MGWVRMVLLRKRGIKFLVSFGEGMEWKRLRTLGQRCNGRKYGTKDLVGVEDNLIQKVKFRRGNRSIK